MRGAGGAENRRVTLEEAPTPLCCNPLHPARPRNPTREGGVSLFIRDWSFTTTKKGMLGHAVVSREQVSHVFCCFCFFFFFLKRIPKINPNQIKTKQTQNPRSDRSKPKRTQTKCGWREEDGRRTRCRRWNKRSIAVCLSVSVRAAVPACLKLCSMDGGDLEEQQTAPPLLCPPLSSSALWSWMELNANDLTELKSYLKGKKNLFLFFCWLVPIVLSLLCLLMPFYVLYFSAYYYLFGITYSLTYYKSYFFCSRARDFYQVVGKKYCENLASRFLLDKETDCLGRKKNWRRTQ